DTFNRSRGFIDVIGSLALNIRLGDLPPPPAPREEPAPPPPPPAPVPEPEPEPEVIFEFDSMVTFGLDSSQLRPEATTELDEAAALLNLHNEIVKIEVAGYTCDLGEAGYNQGLSERRATAVRDYLVNEGGVDADRLMIRGYGEERPKVPNTSTENRQQNRRVELIVIEREDG
ncbi:MAG TPA: OmpA family protein, partial [Wenzhouxiangella sp.]|nr:OmpA family protein [Wenzhouxiangella sp.]